MVLRDSPEYYKTKLAWQLSQAPEFKEYLRPLIESLIPSTLPRARDGFTACFEIADKQGRKDGLETLLACIDQDANSFVHKPVSAGLRPSGEDE